MGRTNALSDDLRWALVHMNTQGLTAKEISKLSGQNLRTVQRILRLFKDSGEVSPKPGVRLSGAKLRHEHLQYMSACLEHSPDTYLLEMKAQLEEMCGVKVSLPTVWRALRRMGFTYKKISKHALERNQERRTEYIVRMGINYEPNQLVFVDESSFDRRTSYRGYAWALRGRRAVRSCFYVRGKRYSVLPALSVDGVIWCDIVEGAFNTARFLDFIGNLLNQMEPFPAPKSVIVMDNAKIHRAPEIVELIESRGMRVEFLPAYSPDFNPIEQAFSIMKSRFRRDFPHFARTCSTGTSIHDDTEARNMLLDVVFSVTPQLAESFYHHSRYL